MAWAEKLPSGKWRGGWRDPGGGKHYTSRTEFPQHPWDRKSDAKAAAQEAEVKARRQAAVTHGTLSAGTAWGDWWDATRPERPDSDTGQAEHYIVEKYVRPKWGDTPLNKIQHRLVQSWVTKELAPGRSARYVRRIYAVFQTSMNRAVDEEVLDASPCVRIKLPKAQKRPKPYVDEAHLKALAQTNTRGRPHLRDPAQQDLLEVGYETGLRPGELCGMHVEQLDLDAGWIDVTHVYVRSKNVIRPWPKDKDARRVPLSAKAVEILRLQVAGRELTGCAVPHTDGKPCKSALVFLNKRDEPITPRALYQAMAKAAKRAGVAFKSPYAVRRGAATWMAEGGLDAFTIAAFFGHEDIGLTAGYVQQTPAARDRLRAARGEATGLSLVAGADPAGHLPQPWGKRGADLDQTTEHETPPKVVEDTG